VILSVAFFSQRTAQFAVLGLASGAMFALVALGVVVAYRSSQVLNFSSAAFGAVAAFVFYDLVGHMPWPLALLIVLVLGGVLGALTALVLRLLAGASQLARLIATLGLLSVAEGFIAVVWPGANGQPNTFLPSHELYLTATVAVPSDQVILIAIALVLAVGLWWLYGRTLFGLATSAVSESRRVTSSYGWSPLALELANFTVAGVLSALAAVLLAPIIGLQASVLALTVIPALAAALVGGFSSFGLTVGAALLIGLIESELSWFLSDIASFVHVQETSIGSLPEVVPLAIIIVAIVARGRTRPQRGEVLAKLPLPGSGIVRPVLLLVGVGAGLALTFGLSAAWADAFIVTFATAIIVLSVVVVTGLAGQLSLCQFALAGFGCWIAAKLSSGIPFWIAIVGGVAGTVALGLIVAVIALRSRGVNFAIVTMGLAVMISDLILTNPALTGGLSGLNVPAPHLFGVDLDPIATPDRYGAFVLIVFVLCGLAVANVRRGRGGRRMLAVRSNERAAAALGVGVFGAKMYSFALASAIAALGGILLGFQDHSVELGGFDVFSSIQSVLYAVFGGVGWVSGTVAGALAASGGAVSTLINDWFPGVSTINYWLMIFAGVSVIVILWSAPDGVAALNSKLVQPLRAGLTSMWPGPRLRQRRADVAESAPTPRRPPVALEVEDLTVTFGGLVAVASMSFSVRPGEVVGLMGPNGAGKTTILDVVTGFTPAASGSVSLGGEPISGWSPERRARAGMARSWQAVELFDEMTVQENLLVAADEHRPVHYLSDLVHPNRRQATALIDEVVAELGISEHLASNPSELSHGTARLVGIARAMVGNPGILLLDEPAAGLDATQTAELGTVIRQLAANRGIGVLLIEHDVPLLLSCCSRIVVLDFGKKIAEGPPEEISQNPDVIRAYLGEDDSREGADLPGTPAVEPVTGPLPQGPG
jgi:ABC-type branched-subunit amino acid transport system ATPase component/ABC-type branched-subunit amino acid transport system permease subunit